MDLNGVMDSPKRQKEIAFSGLSVFLLHRKANAEKPRNGVKWAKHKMVL